MPLFLSSQYSLTVSTVGGTNFFLDTLVSSFIFPSFFEGFGIPPLEAMSVGAKCIIAKTSCLPEIFGDAAYWIDPYDTNVDLDELLSKEVASPKTILEKYTFESFAGVMHKTLLELIK